MDYNTRVIRQLAQIDLGENYLLGPDLTVRDNLGSPGQVISSIFPNVFIVAGLILFFLIAFGGFTIVTSGGNPEQTAKGQQAITGAIIGFIIIFASYWIIQAVQVVTGVQILNPVILQ